MYNKPAKYFGIWDFVLIKECIEIADKKNIRIKPFIVTRLSTSVSVASKIRKQAHEFLTKYIASISFDNFANDLISHKMQDALRYHLKKVYPVRVCEIRSMQVEKLHKPETEKKAKVIKKDLKTKEFVKEIDKIVEEI